jgi:hypothetical protein
MNGAGPVFEQGLGLFSPVGGSGLQHSLSLIGIFLFISVC